MDLRVLQELQVPHDADFYLYGPAAFMSDLTVGLTNTTVS
jgi:ferredoxin-NADP reductase